MVTASQVVFATTEQLSGDCEKSEQMPEMEQEYCVLGSSPLNV